jgi:hypothetical protein
MDTFTSKAIAPIIEQLRKRQNITINEVKDEGDAIRVLGTARINYMPVDRDAIEVRSGEVYGSLLYLKKAQ